MARFNDKRLNDYDVMQHISNIYDIIGTTDKKSVETGQSNNISERLDEVQHGNFIQWSGTLEEYKIAKASGLITPTMLCAITDDYYEPESSKVGIT